MQFPYHAKWSAALMGVLVFGASLAFYLYRALNNQAGMIIDGILELGPTGATRVYAAFATLLAVFVVIAILSIVRRYTHPKVLLLREDALVLPHGHLQLRETIIPYAEIQAIEEVEFAGQPLLHIYTGGRKHIVAASLLPDRWIFQRVKQLLKAQIGLLDDGGDGPW